MQQKHTRESTGFTLIELLVVIAIIAILASMLFPVFLSTKRSARLSTCANNLKQISQAFGLYKSDWSGWYPLGGSREANSDRSFEWQNVTWKYVRKDSVYRCPDTRLPELDMSKPYDEGSDAAKPRAAVTYLYNGYIGFDDYNPTSIRSHADGQIKRATECILLMEGFYKSSSAANRMGTDAHGQTNTLWLRDFVFRKDAGGVLVGTYGMPWHEGGNVLFCDGHAKFHRYHDAVSLERTLPWAAHACLQGGGAYLSESDKWRE